MMDAVSSGSSDNNGGCAIISPATNLLEDIESPSVSNLHDPSPVEGKSDFQNLDMIINNYDIADFLGYKKTLSQVHISPFVFTQYGIPTVAPWHKKHQQLSSSQEKMQYEEWKSVCQNLKDYIHQEQSIQQIRNEMKSFCLMMIPILSFAYYVYTNLMFLQLEDSDASNILFGTIILLMAILLFCTITYRKYGTSKMIVLNKGRRAFLSKTLLVIVVSYTILVTKNVIELKSWIVLIPILYILLILLIVGCIHGFIACWIRYDLFLGRQDKALRKIYHEVKRMNSTLTYVYLQPKVGFHDGSVLVNVYAIMTKNANNLKTVTDSNSDVKFRFQSRS